MIEGEFWIRLSYIIRWLKSNVGKNYIQRTFKYPVRVESLFGDIFSELFRFSLTFSSVQLTVMYPKLDAKRTVQYPMQCSKKIVYEDKVKKPSKLNNCL